MEREMNNVRILQWNCQSIPAKLPELQHRANNFEIILLSETWLSPEDNTYIRGFDVVRSDRLTHNGGGVAIFISHKLKYKKVTRIFNCNNNIETCAIEIFTQDKKLTIASYYRPPNNHIRRTMWVRFLSQFDGKFVIGGDLNIHHPLWGDRQSCREGTKVFDALEELDVGILNDNSPTFCSRQYNTLSAIDLSIVDDASILSYSWSVSEDSWGSDHFPITIILNEKVASQTKIQTTRRLYNCRTDWEKVNQNLKSRTNQCRELINDTRIDTQEKYTTFTAIITDSL